MFVKRFTKTAVSMLAAAVVATALVVSCGGGGDSSGGGSGGRGSGGPRVRYTKVPDTVFTVVPASDRQSLAIAGYNGPININIALPTTLMGRPVTEVGEGAFMQSLITGVSIPEGYKVIDDMAFGGSTITSVELPNSLTDIGMGAFAMTGLSSVNIPDGVTYIGDSAFFDCQSLTSATIGSGVTAFGRGVFASSGLTELTFNARVIPNNAFRQISSLTTVTLGDNVTEIGDLAFAETDITSITIPNSVTRIGRNVFRNVLRSGLTSLTVNAREIPAFAFEKLPSLTTVTLGDNVEIIGGWAFRETGITSITIPSSVMEIGRGAFNETPLTSVTIGNRATRIGQEVLLSAFPHGVQITYSDASTNQQAAAAPSSPAAPTSGDRKFVNSTGTGVLNLRAEPNGDAELLVAIPHGDPVTVLGSAGRDPWVRISYNNMTGFVNSRFLSDTRP